MDNRIFLVAGLAAVVLIVGGSAGYQLLQQKRGTAAIIPLSGQITPSSPTFASSGITPGQVRDLNQQARNRGASAIIYEINSGGGAVVASKEVMRAIDSVEKPTVCRIRDVGASGAYLASLGCDRIVADSASLTGSVGVRASYLEFSGLLQKLGIEYVNITAGRYKDLGSQYQNISQEEREILQEKIGRVHEEFVSTVEENRDLSRAEVEQVSTGEAFLGERAMELGLVDEIGGRNASLELAENMTGKKLDTTNIQARPSFNLFSLLTADIGFPGIATSAPLKSTFPAVN